MRAAPADMLAAVRAVLIEAFGDDLSGSERGARVSGYYLARIRDLLRGDIAPRAGAADDCDDCRDLRARLVNIYHLTITGQNDASTVRAIRRASGPGAPAPPAREYSGTIAQHGRCGVDCIACAAGTPREKPNA